jgi:hypothetical protein
MASAALALGAFAQLAQVLVFREVMAVCHGTEILFGVILAAGLGWTALGTFLGILASRRQDAGGSGRRFDVPPSTSNSRFCTAGLPAVVEAPHVPHGRTSQPCHIPGLAAEHMRARRPSAQ